MAIESQLSISKITLPDENGNTTSYKIKDSELWNKVSNISKEIFNELYPVGSLYWTTNQSFDPNNYFKGKWGRIEDCYIRAAKRDESIKKSGSEFISFGKDERVLTVENLPNHTHDVTGGEHSHNLHTPSNDFFPGNTGITANLVKTSSNLEEGSIQYGSDVGFYVEKATPIIKILPEGKGLPFDNRPKSISAYCWQRIE